jgi:uncharacterized protein (TIGR03067 family)
MRALLAALSMIATAAAAQEPLQGAWTALEAERNGAAAPDLVGHRLRFDGEAFEIAGPDGAPIYAGSFRTDPAAEPAAIDFVNTAGEAAGVTWAGIWRLDGTTLTIVDNAPDPSRPRPADFAAPAASGYVMVTFRRP